ncbi:MAG: hypothetical protein ABIH86_03955 [Planctomycetota bacterium]
MTSEQTPKNDNANNAPNAQESKPAPATSDRPVQQPLTGPAAALDTDLVMKVVKALPILVALLLIAFLVVRKKQDPEHARNKAAADTIYDIRKGFLAEKGRTEDEIKERTLLGVWNELDTADQIAGLNRVIDQAGQNDAALKTSVKATLAKLEMANDYRMWAERYDATRVERLERLQNADQLYGDVLKALNNEFLFYYSIALTRAGVLLDIAMLQPDGDKKATLESAVSLISDSLRLPTDRKYPEETRLRFLQGIAQYKLWELDGRTDSGLKSDAEANLETAHNLLDGALEIDIADDILRRMKEKPSITLAGSIDNAMETSDGVMRLSMPKTNVNDDILDALLAPDLPELKTPPHLRGVLDTTPETPDVSSTGAPAE